MIIFAAMLLIGCSDTSLTQKSVKQQKTLEVSLKSETKEVLLNETATFTAIVEYGDTKISKDAVVQFEMIENGVSIGLVSPKNVGDGQYVLETKFLEPGEKQVVAHVNYKTLHEMPVLTFTVKK